jgi:formylglycine-generating enzyme required for sulfatase activity
VIRLFLLSCVLLFAVACSDGGNGGGAPDDFVYIEGGTFTMGSPNDELNRGSDETQHQVTVSSFYMGAYEVTQAEWVAVMGSNPSYSAGDDLPVEQVSWYDAVAYCNARSVQRGLTPVYTINGTNVTMDISKNGYRLPTEAEWEYAARAGTTTAYNTGASITTAQANFDNSINETVAVGSYAPNDWGLYDMHGNVLEWVWDWYDTYPSNAQTNPTGPASGLSGRILRGGAWNNSAEDVRSAFRFGGSLDPTDKDPSGGFRVVRR